MKRFVYCILLFFINLQIFGDTVKIVSKEGKFYLTVNNKPFVVKGVGVTCAVSKNVNYLLMARNLGCNAVRTWGIDQGCHYFLDEAAKQNLKVLAGIWFDYTHSLATKEKVFSYVQDFSNDKTIKSRFDSALKYIKKYKNHPAILGWLLGNEVVYFSLEKKEKIAFCKRLEKLCKQVKKIDPNHPVGYVIIGNEHMTDELEYVLKYVPSLDFIGINQFEPRVGVAYINQVWKQYGVDKPFILTEFGPEHFSFAIKRNGFYEEPSDFEKAYQYEVYLNNIYNADLQTKSPFCLGACAFRLGEGDHNLWWNLTYKGIARPSYESIRAFFLRTKKHYVPKCKFVFPDKYYVNKMENIIIKIPKIRNFEVFYTTGKRLRRIKKFGIRHKNNRLELVLPSFKKLRVKSKYLRIYIFARNQRNGSFSYTTVELTTKP